MRSSWQGLQLVLLSCALLLAMVEGVHGKEEESSPSSEEKSSSSSEEEPPHRREKRHISMEECCEKRCHHEEEECCCEKRCHHEEEDCCCEKWCHHEEEECCYEKRHHHEDEECCKKKHSHGKEDAGKNKAHHDGEKRFRKRFPFLERSEEATSDSSEIYMRFAKHEQERIMELAAQTSDGVSPSWRERAITHFNQGSQGSYYKHLEDGQMEYKKAIGVMVYVRMLLAETNCTKTKEEEEAGVEYSRAYLEKEDCQLLPQLKQEKHNCTFGIFLDMRTEKKAVVSQDCIIIPGIKQLPKSLKGLRF